MAVVGMVICNVRRTLHAARTVRSAVEIVGILAALMRWLWEGTRQMSILLDLMCTSTVVKHLLFVALRVDLYTRAAKVARILWKLVIMAALFLEGIAQTRMALRS